MNVNVFGIGDKVMYSSGTQSYTGTICSGLICGKSGGDAMNGIDFLCYLVEFDRVDSKLGEWVTLRSGNDTLNYYTTIFVIAQAQLKRMKKSS